jgi:hypothetical protein
MIEACVKAHSINEKRPQIGGDRLITMGVDQGKTGYISVVDWLFDQPPGKDINAAAIGKLLWFGKFSGEEWAYLDELMREWQVSACVVDADPFTNDARRFAKKFHGYVWLTRYRRGQTAKQATPGGRKPGRSEGESSSPPGSFRQQRSTPGKAGWRQAPVAPLCAKPAPLCEGRSAPGSCG